jgi:hypothetical protein
LNTVEGDFTFGSLSSNQITLSAGKYLISALCPAYASNNLDIGAHKARVYDITNSQTLLLGSQINADTTSNISHNTFSIVNGVIDISSDTVIELQHRTSFARANGFGVSSSFSEDEVYSQITITKISNNQVGQELGGNRDIIVEGAGNGGTSITANTTDIDFTETRDTTASFDGTTFTAPETGEYKFTGSIDATGAWAGNIQAYVNGSAVKVVNAGSDTQTQHTFAGNISLTKGESLTFRSSTSITLSNSIANHWIYISKDNSAKTLVESETVAARYSTDSGAVVNNLATILYEDLGFDTHNAYNTSTGIYTVAAKGIYDIKGSFRAGGSSSELVSIEVNGVIVARNIAGDATGSIASVHTIYELNKGDEVKIINASGAARTMTADSTENFFSIHRIK